MINTDLTLSIVAPMYNEAGSVNAFLNRLLSVMEKHFLHYEIILVDDGSIDDTFSLCKAYSEKNSCIRVLSFSRNYGHEVALTAGLEHAQGEWVVQMDSDLQHPPELIPSLVNQALQGYEVVYAARKNRQNETWLKKNLARCFYKVARRMTGFNIPSDASNFRVIHRKVVDSLCKLKESNRHLIMLYAYVGFKTSSIPFEVENRHAGKTKYNYPKLMNLALDSIISFSHRPLRYMSMISVLISIFLFCYAGFIVLQKLFSLQHMIDGMASLIFIMSGLFAILFLFLAVISEYIGRILVESKNRPLYYIRETYGTGLLSRNSK